MFISCIIALASVMSAVQDANRPADFGKQWVRSHPITITSLIMMDDTFDANVYASAGMNTVLVWKGRENIFAKTAAKDLPWFYRPLPKYNEANHPDTINPLTPERMEASLQFYKKYPRCQGFIVMDEPRHVHFNGLAKAMQWYKTQFPQELILANVYMAGKDPGAYYQSPKDANGQYLSPPVKYEYEDYLREYLQMCRPDVLMTDVYPFADYDGCDDTAYIHSKYFRTLEMIRKMALEQGVPYWTFIQAFEHKGNWYYPSESNVRMQVFSSLAYGFTGLAYFHYYTPTEESLVNDDSSPKPLLKDITVINREVSNLGKTLVFLKSEKVFYIPGTQYMSGKNNGNPIPEMVAKIEVEKLKRWGISDIKVQGISEKKNGLIGLFTDDNGGLYFMLVNLRNYRGVGADQLPGEFVIKLNPSVRNIFKLSRESGKIEEAKLDSGSLNVVLPGGTGDLFKINDANFAGI